MNKHLIAVVTLLIAVPAYAKNGADEFFIDAGLGTFSTEGHSLADVKFAKIGIQEDVWYALKQRFNVGAWLDKRVGAADAGFVGYQLGFDVKNELFEMGIFSGPSLISATDSSLGGYFQFNETVFVGIRDPKSDDAIGVSYNHFSSAGLEMPNQGKDFMCLEIKFPF
jgi:hypothetical protein